MGKQNSYYKTTLINDQCKKIKMHFEGKEKKFPATKNVSGGHSQDI